MFPHFDFSIEEKAVRWKWKYTRSNWADWTPESAKKRSVSRWACKKRSLINSLCNLPDVPGITDMNEIVLGGLLLQSARYFRILSVAAQCGGPGPTAQDPSHSPDIPPAHVHTGLPLPVLCLFIINGESESYMQNLWIVVYSESLKRELKTKTIYGYRWDERLKTNIKESTRLACTPLWAELEHLKIETRLTSETPVSEMGEYACVML